MSSIIKNLVQGCWKQVQSLALFYSAVKSATGNTRERHSYLTPVAGRYRSKSRENLDNDERIVLTGQAPRVGHNCHAYGSYTSELEFTLLKSIAESLSPEPEGSGNEEAKPEATLMDADKPSGATAQPSATNDDRFKAKDGWGMLRASRSTLGCRNQAQKRRPLGVTIWIIMCSPAHSLSLSERCFSSRQA